MSDAVCFSDLRSEELLRFLRRTLFSQDDRCDHTWSKRRPLLALWVLALRNERCSRAQAGEERKSVALEAREDLRNHVCGCAKPVPRRFGQLFESLHEATTLAHVVR